MAELKVYLSDELDKRFRKAAMDAYGYGRGSISKAATEAFSRWCVEHEASPNVREETTAAPINATPIAEADQPMDSGSKGTNVPANSASG